MKKVNNKEFKPRSIKEEIDLRIKIQSEIFETSKQEEDFGMCIYCRGAISALRSIKDYINWREDFDK